MGLEQPSSAQPDAGRLIVLYPPLGPLSSGVYARVPPKRLVFSACYQTVQLLVRAPIEEYVPGGIYLAI